jgi:hypothetical protein
LAHDFEPAGAVPTGNIGTALVKSRFVDTVFASVYSCTRREAGMRLFRLVSAVVLVCGLVATQGCALFVVGAAAVGAGVGTASYMGNELRITREVTLDNAWTAANDAVKELEFRVDKSKTVKDAMSGTIEAMTAQNQPVRIQVLRQSDKLTEIRVRVGTFDTTANRQSAQLIYDKMNKHL